LLNLDLKLKPWKNILKRKASSLSKQVDFFEKVDKHVQLYSYIIVLLTIVELRTYIDSSFNVLWTLYLYNS